MHSNPIDLFKNKSFLSIFIAQFCGCFNDNLIKNALIILITYKLSNELEYSAKFLVLLANALFLFPFVIFASIAGQISDRYERADVIKVIKIAEMAIILISFHGFYNNNLTTLFFSITLMGVHSAFFGPVKYSILPDHLHKSELLAANGLVEAGTFISILVGTMIGGMYNFSHNFVIFSAIVISIIGIISSFFIKKSNNFNPSVKISFRLFRDTINIIKYAHSKKQVYLAILGISWFWFIGAALLAQIPSLTKDIIGADEYVVNLFLAAFSIGVGVGSFLCAKILNNKITAKYTFVSSLLISILGIDLFFATSISAENYDPEHLKSILMFLSSVNNWRILLDLFLFATVAGVYVVPLFAVMQYFTSTVYRSRVIAANNLINALFMVSSTIILSLLFHLGYSIPFIILLVSLANIVVAIYIFQLMPKAALIPIPLLRALLKFLFDKMYKVEVKGMENFYKAGKKVVIVANHISYIDPAMISVYLPSPLTFAINTAVSKETWVKPFLKLVKAFPLDPTNSMAIKSLVNLVKQKHKVVIFPEGRISTTGSLMKIYEGPGMIADKSGAVILPIRINGTQYTHFSKIKNIVRARLFPKITITILPPVSVDSALLNEDPRTRRKVLVQNLYDIMSDMLFESSGYKQTLFHSLIDAAKIYGYSKKITMDYQNNSDTYRSLIMKSFILADIISKHTKAQEHVGIMLPNVSATLTLFYAAQCSGRIPTMVNFTSGSYNIVQSCKCAKVSTLYTSKKFIDTTGLHGIVHALKQNNIKVLFLEDLRSSATILKKLKGFLGSMAPEIYYNKLCKKQDPNSPAVVLFTSGTEAAPKAVALSHANIQANKEQILSRIDLNQSDIAFNSLPMFHCFGLTGAILMSLNGVHTFYYPSPLHYRIIPEIIYDIGATILFSTNTFLSGYAQYAHPYDFYSLRYVFAGAEKLKPSTNQLWLEKYGIRIFEGYGVTECSPVIAVNTPMHYKPGTVGRLFPKVQYCIEKVEGIDVGGRLLVKGPNVMLGYMNINKPGVITLTKVANKENGWYDTGDIVSFDDEGYLSIIGRAKRFAKVGGEMISLAAVEGLAQKINDQETHAAVYVESNNKTEQIILFTTSNELKKDDFIKIIKTSGFSELYIPKIIIYIEKIPVLATGKVDYNELNSKAGEYQGKEKVKVLEGSRHS